MKFECIDTRGNESVYALYDYSDTPFKEDEPVLLIVIRENKKWWFHGKPREVMNQDHMKALYDFLVEQLAE